MKIAVISLLLASFTVAQEYVKCPYVKTDPLYTITGMWYQASRSLNGIGEAVYENGQCVQKRWDNFSEKESNNFYELITQYNKNSDLIEAIREETIIADGHLIYFNNATGKFELND